MKNRPYVICFGEVLWDVVDDKGLIGGAPLNVCYHLTRHDIQSRLISQVGNDPKGAELLSGISQLDVDTSMISISSDLPTSEVLVHISEKGHVSYTIVENVAWDAIPYKEEHAREVARADCFVFGSLASRSKTSEESLFHYLQFAQWKVMDLNLRKPFYNKERIEKLLSACDTLKINDDELNLIVEFFGINGDNNEELFRGIMQQFTGIKEIIVTRGAEGAEYFSPGTHITVPARPVKVVDTVGAGDAFLAAFLSGKLNHKSIPQCMQDAVVLSGFVAASRGACPKYHVEEVYGGSGEWQVGSGEVNG